MARSVAVDPAEAHARVARHVGAIVARALRGLPATEREIRQAEIANDVIRLLAHAEHVGHVVTEDDAIVVSPEALTALRTLWQ